MTITPVYSAHLSGTPLGGLRLWATDQGLRRLDLHSGSDLAHTGETLSEGSRPAHLTDTLTALTEYFAGNRTSFETPLDLHGVTDFQRRVYEKLLEIPYGKVVTYADVAEDIGEGRGAARAVGQAVGANPVAIVIPCHRVVASDATLHGYSGGLGRKATLLSREGIQVDGVKASSKVHPEVLQLPL